VSEPATLMATHSEAVFEKICINAGYGVVRPVLRDAEGVATADFIVSTSTTEVIVEVEELRPNRDDLRQIREMENGGCTGGGSTIGQRARIHLRRAARQLKPYSSQKIPLIVALYDNVRVGRTRVAYPMFYLQPHEIDAAMFGDRTVYVSLASAGVIQTRPDINGGRQTLTPTQKTYVSAVAVISDADDSTVIFYHNHFASRPLTPDLFVGQNFFHLRKPTPSNAAPWQWVAR
jgi:hypothetical protein